MSDNPAATAPQPKPETPEFSLGGQALIEGVMMRSPNFIAASVRRADGSIETRVEKFDSVAKRNRVLRLPFIRGVVGLVEMMTIGMRFLNWSAQKAMESEAVKIESAEGAAAAQGFVGAGAAVAVSDAVTADSEPA